MGFQKSTPTSAEIQRAVEWGNWFGRRKLQFFAINQFLEDLRTNDALRGRPDPLVACSPRGSVVRPLMINRKLCAHASGELKRLRRMSGNRIEEWEAEKRKWQRSRFGPSLRSPSGHSG
jgi:hypothetical protein